MNRGNLQRVGGKWQSQVHIAHIFCKYPPVFLPFNIVLFLQYMWHSLKNVSDQLLIYPTCLVNIHIPLKKRSKVKKWLGNILVIGRSISVKIGLGGLL